MQCERIINWIRNAGLALERRKKALSSEAAGGIKKIDVKAIRAEASRVGHLRPFAKTGGYVLEGQKSGQITQKIHQEQSKMLLCL